MRVATLADSAQTNRKTTKKEQHNTTTWQGEREKRERNDDAGSKGVDVTKVPEVFFLCGCNV